MEIGAIYTITLGNWSDKYLCVSEDSVGFRLTRIRLPQTKIDAVRLPENIRISTPMHPIKNKNNE